MNYNLEAALKHYLLLLKKEAFFEAHEVLEEAWHPLRLTNHPLKNLVKGLINGAIAFEHMKRNKVNMPQKVKKVIASFERYKHLCREEIEHYTLFYDACSHIEALKQLHGHLFEVDTVPHSRL
jgi:predicted metal-dependent hydrolase